MNADMKSKKLSKYLAFPSLADPEGSKGFMCDA